MPGCVFVDPLNTEYSDIKLTCIGAAGTRASRSPLPSSPRLYPTVKSRPRSLIVLYFLQLPVTRSTNRSLILLFFFQNQHIPTTNLQNGFLSGHPRARLERPCPQGHLARLQHQLELW